MKNICGRSEQYHLLPALAVLCYVDLLGLVYINGGRIMLLKVILVPFITFAGVSVFRKCVNAKRPYTIYGTTPIVAKDKTGESMPSRHTASFTVIAIRQRALLCLFWHF